MSNAKPIITPTDGNIFSILGAADAALTGVGRGEQVRRMKNRVFDSKSYDEALAVITEYVEIRTNE